MSLIKVKQSSVDGGVGVTRPNAKPLIINGDFAVAQRGTSQTNIASNAGYKTVDRWQVNNQGSFVGDATVSQSTTTPTGQGFAHSIKFDCTTAGSPSANSSVYFEQKIEAQDCQLFKLGTSSAEKITVSFWVYATKTGTNILRLEQEDVQRQCSQSYTVSSSNTWEKKVVVFPADTSGAGITDDNGIGLELWFYMAAGSNYTSGTLATSWEAVSGNDANKAVGQVNNFDNTSNDFIITGVQLEVGEYTSSTIPSFQHESFGNNLKRCERYFQVIAKKESGDNEDAVLPFAQYSGSTIYGVYNFRTEMRTAPSLLCANGTNYFRWFRENSNTEFNTFVLDKSSPQTCDLYQSVSGTQGVAGWVRMINNAPDGSLVSLNGEL
tara:strand:+ start:445 stop:1584 length:1140 start_codon:yes stop_codon:yes gene_type:complete